MATATDSALRAYVTGIERAYRLGNATEHTYRPALQTLLETPVSGITATNEPKRVACGAPDYVISRPTTFGPLTIGYVEAKDIGKPLGEVERDEQLTRYRSTLPNLLLTDYLEFRWYVNGAPRERARLAAVGTDGRIVLHGAALPAVIALLEGFLTRSPEPIRSPQELARRMAGLTHHIRDLTLAAMESTDPAVERARRALEDLRTAFAQVLIPDLAPGDFSDMFAQTLAYGLFAARYNHSGARPFTRQDAAREIPRTNPFLRRLFEVVTGSDLDDAPFVGFVDDLAQMLAATDMAAVLADFGKRTRQEDPVVHFYETFLAAYDPEAARVARGLLHPGAGGLLHRALCGCGAQARLWLARRAGNAPRGEPPTCAVAARDVARSRVRHRHLSLYRR